MCASKKVLDNLKPLSYKVYMARNTEITKGKHLIKPNSYGGRIVVGIPRALALQAGMDGQAFVGAMVVGKCVVLAQVDRVNGDEFATELTQIFDRAILEWEEKGNGN